MSKELKTQWHPAFVSAMKLELLEDAEYLDYTSEYNLNTKPLEMDLLIVKKDKDVEIHLKWFGVRSESTRLNSSH